VIFLRKIVIHGFKSPSKSIQVFFSKLQTSVIYGDNGCGKTTFLKILNAIFKQDDNTLLEEEVDSILIEYKTSNSDKFGSEEIEWINQSVEILKVEVKEPQLSFDQVLNTEFRFNWDDFSNSELAKSKSLSLGVDRGTQTSRLNLNSNLLVSYLSRRPELRSSDRGLRHIHEFAQDLLMFLKRRSDSSKRDTNAIDYSDSHVLLKEVNMDNIESTLLGRYRNARRTSARKIQNALFDTLASAITDQNNPGPKASEFVQDNFNQIINKNKDLLIEALDDKTENSFKDRIVKELRKIENEDDINKLKKNALLSKLLLEMSEQLKDSEAELSAINTVIDKFNAFTRDDKTLIINNNEIQVRIGQNNHSISKLSSGERHILTLFTLLLDQGRQRNFIIIDEPEISLNATWQKQLMPTLEKLMPSCQIIAASHSAILADSLDNLAELEVIKDEEAYSNEECLTDNDFDEFIL
jgi:energy-coupling factor transporter ATP-binding protein EcfA2